MSSPSKHTQTAPHESEDDTLTRLREAADIDTALRKRMKARAVELVERIREDSDASMMELFLGEYGLSTDEGVALMCLAEALLRVPDSETMDALIEDKIAPSEWGRHLGKSHSSLINASTWALFMTGKVLTETKDDSVVGILQGAVKRLGEPVIRQAVTRVMKELGRQFVLGETIGSATLRAEAQQEKGFTYSYDMLGEAAKTEADAKRYLLAYSDAIGMLANVSSSDDIRENPGISIKLSALHPRYEELQRDRVMRELVPRALSLAVLAKSAGIGLNVDAEEAGRLELSLDVIEAVASDPVLRNWDGFGIVVQAYNRNASHVIDRLYALAQKLDRKFMIRLVKGAYWDTEIKHAQVEGHDDFPVFTRKAATDVSYICCAKKLLSMTDRLYPQFATHNAHTVAAVLELADDKSAFEFQRLHGMGEALHETVLRRQKTRCRIYAPVGAHKDLLAYLVRRLLENGANSSFVNQIVDESVPPERVAADPFEELDGGTNTRIAHPSHLFHPERENSRGWDIEDPVVLEGLKSGMARFAKKRWSAGSKFAAHKDITNPANGEIVGHCGFATSAEAQAVAQKVKPWNGQTAAQRSEVLSKVADLYENNAHETFALLAREAGKTLRDCIGELREAVDFLRYCAAQAENLPQEKAGVFTCISPWNFPLAIFTGQISAALAAGNGVLAKPAETTPLIAEFAVGLMHKAGVPKSALQLIPGEGAVVGAALTGMQGVTGVCFTGSTPTAQAINRNMANSLDPSAPLIAETGGLNAMIVDSTALPEQAITDILASAFQSAGQRCSALRVLYLQEDIAPAFLKMLYGAMDELSVDDPLDFSTDVGPVIDEAAQKKIEAHIDQARSEGRLLKQLNVPETGTFVAPTVLSVSGIGDLREEIFGPVLHVATFKADQIDNVITEINAQGYGLTFGLHSRIDDRVQHIVERVNAGNIYVNRNQIGAVVGSQPFGGEGLSGTGPKAGGPRYLPRFRPHAVICEADTGIYEDEGVSADAIQQAFDNIRATPVPSSKPMSMPGPTGESNQLSVLPRDRVLCLGPGAEYAQEQARRARALGCRAIAIAPGVRNGIDGWVSPQTLAVIDDLDAVVTWSDRAGEYRRELALRTGAIVPLVTEQEFEPWLQFERHVCVDTTAAGGNAALLAG